MGPPFLFVSALEDAPVPQSDSVRRTRALSGQASDTVNIPCCGTNSSSQDYQSATLKISVGGSMTARETVGVWRRCAHHLGVRDAFVDTI